MCSAAHTELEGLVSLFPREDIVLLLTVVKKNIKYCPLLPDLDLNDQTLNNYRIHFYQPKI